MDGRKCRNGPHQPLCLWLLLLLLVLLAVQTAEGVRLRCLEAQELIGHLQTFSCHSAGNDFSKLPSIFTNDATLAEAAVRMRRVGAMDGLMHPQPLLKARTLSGVGGSVC